MNYLVDIPMCVYNHEKFIAKAIEGVIIQNTNFKFRLILGEDASTDNSKEIIMDYVEKYPDIIFTIFHKQNVGMKENSRLLFSKCTSKYIALCDGDDYWTDPLKLQKQVAFLEANPKFTFSFTRYKYVFDLELEEYPDRNERFFKFENDFIIFNFEMFTKGWAGGLSTFMFRAESFDLKSTIKYKYFRDVHIYTELLKRGNGVCLNFFSTVYRVHDGGIHTSATVLERAKTAKQCYKELYKNNKLIPALRIKYRYFQREYIKALIPEKYYITAFVEAVRYGLYMYDFYFMYVEIIRIMKDTYLGKLFLNFRTILNKTNR